MKAMAVDSPNWHIVVVQLRSLCKFLRNPTWRKNVVRCLRGRGLNLEVWDDFTATLAKWRFETMDDVLEQLAPFRPYFEEHLQMFMFENAQNRAEIQSAMDTGRDKYLWDFIQYAGPVVFKPTENIVGGA